MSRNPRFTSNLQAMRLIAAYLILIRHSLILTGDRSPLYGVSIPSMGIWIFFAISGYLLLGSWARQPRVGTFFRARIRRLLPSLAVVVVASAVLLGPLLGTLPLREYYSQPQTWEYLTNIVVRPSYFLPGVFAANPYPGAVNGSLWSLPPQVLTYALVPIVFLLRARWLRIMAWFAIIALSSWDSVALTFSNTVVWGSSVSQALVVIGFFAAGALIRELRVPLLLPVAAGLALLAVLGAHLLPAAEYTFSCMAIPYIVITISLRSWSLLRFANRLPDVSYGVFLVGFPVQQSVIALAPTLNGYLSIAITVIASTALALLLELCVDRPIATRAQNRQPIPAEKAGLPA